MLEVYGEIPFLYNFFKRSQFTCKNSEDILQTKLHWLSIQTNKLIEQRLFINDYDQDIVTVIGKGGKKFVF